MKKIRWMMLTTIIMVWFSQVADGQEVNTNHKETPFSIRISEASFYIEEIKIPRFGNNLTVSKEAQTLLPESDLVIKVRDKRVTKVSTWGIMYRLSLFKNEKSEALDSQYLLIRKGKLTVDGKEVLKEKYQANEIKISDEREGQLVNNIHETIGAVYMYRVSNKDIELNLPAGVPAGVYTATQTVTLVNSVQAE